MCLLYTKPFSTNCKGWKIFEYEKGKIKSFFKGNKKIYPVNEKINEKDFRDYYNTYTESISIELKNMRPYNYKTGFHIYMSKEFAVMESKRLQLQYGEKFIVLPVKFSNKPENICATGMQTSDKRSKTVVVKEMIIIMNYPKKV